MGDFLAQLAKLMGDPRAIFVKVFMFKWYIIMFTAGIMASYYVLTGLHQSGLLPKIEAFIEHHVNASVGIARDCTPKLGNGIKDFLDCVYK